MKTILIIALGLAATGTAAVTFAQTATQPAGDRQARHAKLDTNGDGVIDRSEAAKAPKFAEHFDKLDANKDGRITAGERPQRGMRDGKGGRGDRMAQLDTNKDGVIDRSEAAKAPKFAEHFDKLDANKDGRITVEERPQRGMRDGKGGHGDRMAQLDTNKDGRFSREELAGKERVLQNFAAIDSNQDGALSREEMQAHHKAHRGDRGAPRQPK
jgi:Ca2+-binding EF-hand superfamily protein